MDPVLEEHYAHVRERFEQVFDEAHRWDGESATGVPEELFVLQTRIEKLRDAIVGLAQELEDLEVTDDGTTQGTTEIWRPARIAP